MRKVYQQARRSFRLNEHSNFTMRRLLDGALHMRLQGIAYGRIPEREQSERRFFGPPLSFGWLAGFRAKSGRVKGNGRETGQVARRSHEGKLHYFQRPSSDTHSVCIARVAIQGKVDWDLSVHTVLIVSEDGSLDMQARKPAPRVSACSFIYIVCVLASRCAVPD